MQYIIFYMANIFLKDPFKHQMDAVAACHNTDMDKFAYLMEMGTGKTLTALVGISSITLCIERIRQLAVV